MDLRLLRRPGAVQVDALRAPISCARPNQDRHAQGAITADGTTKVRTSQRGARERASVHPGFAEVSELEDRLGSADPDQLSAVKRCAAEGGLPQIDILEHGLREIR